MGHRKLGDEFDELIGTEIQKRKGFLFYNLCTVLTWYRIGFSDKPYKKYNDGHN
jgi:hypothetical protein